MLLQGFKILERIGTTKAAGMNKTHKKITYISSVASFVKQ